MTKQARFLSQLGGIATVAWVRSLPKQDQFVGGLLAVLLGYGVATDLGGGAAGANFVQAFLDTGRGML